MNTRPRKRPALRPAAIRRLSRFPAASSMRRPCGSATSRLTAWRRASRPLSSATAHASSVRSTAPGLRAASTGPAVALAAIAGRVYRESARLVAGAMDIVTLGAGGAGLQLIPALGGAVARYWLERGAQTWEWLRPMSAPALAGGDPYETAAFPLVPYSNRIRHGRFRFRGIDVAQPLNRP